MRDDDFFSHQQEHSEVKMKIVKEYFLAWAKVMIGAAKRRDNLTQDIVYLDLYAGPGVYKDNCESTPIQVVKSVIADRNLRERVQLIFNDFNAAFVTELRSAISQVEDVCKIHHGVQILNQSVDGDLGDVLSMINGKPTLTFLDPFGYVGISQDLIANLIDGFGCEVIMLFNYNRIKGAVNNQSVKDRVISLFGVKALERLKEVLTEIADSKEKEAEILNTFCDSLKRLGINYTLPYCVRKTSQDSTSHYLIFLTKHEKGYEIMKSTMAKYSSNTDEWIPSFKFDPKLNKNQYYLFDPTYQPEILAKELLVYFRGRTLSFKDIFKVHGPTGPYLRRHYKEVIELIESNGTIFVIPPRKKRIVRKGIRTLADSAIIEFPKDVP